MSFAWEQSMENQNEIKAALARNLRRLREARRLSRRSLAIRAQTTRFDLLEIEAGQMLPDIGLILRLAEALDVSGVALLDATGETGRFPVPDSRAKLWPTSPIRELPRAV